MSLDRLLLEGLASPPEEWTPEVRQAMWHEALAIIQQEARASGAAKLSGEQIEAEIAAARETLRRQIDAGLQDIEAGHVHEGDEVFDELLRGA